MVAKKLVFSVRYCVLTVVVVPAVILKNQMQVKNQTTVKGKLIDGLWVLFDTDMLWVHNCDIFLGNPLLEPLICNTFLKKSIQEHITCNKVANSEQGLHVCMCIIYYFVDYLSRLLDFQGLRSCDHNLKPTHGAYGDFCYVIL